MYLGRSLASGEAAGCPGYTTPDFTGQQGSLVEEARPRLVKHALIGLAGPIGQYGSEEYFLPPLRARGEPPRQYEVTSWPQVIIWYSTLLDPNRL